MSIFTKIKDNFNKRRENRDFARDMENTGYTCDVWELRELRDTPIPVIEHVLQSVGMTIETLHYGFDYPEWLQRGLEQAGLGHISIECFIAFINAKFITSDPSYKRFR